jgi:hypothetical protein
MTRRDASWAILRGASAAGGNAFFTSWLSAAQSAGVAHVHETQHSHAPPDSHDWANYKPQFFSEEEFRCLGLFTSTLIPSDDTPGAREAYVPQFIDFVVHAAAEYAPDMQQHWRAAMEYLQSERFSTLSEEQRVAFLERISEPEHDPAKQHPGFIHYRLIKDMTVHAFYTSRVGLIDELRYQGLAYLTEFPGCNHPEHHEV